MYSYTATFAYKHVDLTIDKHSWRVMMSHWPHLGQVAEDALACEQGWLGRVIAVAGQRDLNRCCCQICANVHWPGKLHSHMDFDNVFTTLGSKPDPCHV